MKQKTLVRLISIILFSSLLVGGISIVASARSLKAISPTLGASGSYSVLAFSTVTNTGTTTISGDVGVSPGTSITGFPPGTVGGNLHAGDAHAANAQIDNAAVFAALDQNCDEIYGAVDLSTIFPEGVGPGVYCSTSSFALSGNLNLIGTQGVWVFKAASTLITSPGASVTGGDPCNVWWSVGSSATLNPSTAFIGNIFAVASITFNTGASLNGRALAQNGAVTLDTNTIFGPICSAQQINTSTPTSTTVPTATSTATSTTTPTTLSTSITPAIPTTTSTSMSTFISTTTSTSTLQTNASTTTQPIRTLTYTPIVPGLPASGGTTINRNVFPWGMAIVGGISVFGLALSIRAYRRTHRRKL